MSRLDQWLWIQSWFFRWGRWKFSKEKYNQNPLEYHQSQSLSCEGNKRGDNYLSIFGWSCSSCLSWEKVTKRHELGFVTKSSGREQQMGYKFWSNESYFTEHIQYPFYSSWLKLSVTTIDAIGLFVCFQLCHVVRCWGNDNQCGGTGWGSHKDQHCTDVSLTQGTTDRRYLPSSYHQLQSAVHCIALTMLL